MSLFSLLQGTLSKTKHEILFTRFGINYNDLPDRYRKGSVLVWEVCCLGFMTMSATYVFFPTQTRKKESVEGDAPPSAGGNASASTLDPSPSPLSPPATTKAITVSGEAKAKAKAKAKHMSEVMVQHCDVIGNEFWDARPALLQ